MASIAFSYQSHGFGLGEWIALFTLSLTPLVTHILTGTPDTIRLYSKPPHWSDRMVHLNPTSILWRYFAILDRRVRSRSWNAADMAASNTLFWTRNGWDGSETMMIKSRAYCIRLPPQARIDLLSGSTLQTILVALQGLQSLYTPTRGAAHYGESISLATIFLPVAIFGLFRLPAALWLSSDFAYGEPRTLQLLSRSETQLEDFDEPIPNALEEQTLAPKMMSLMEHSIDPSILSGEAQHSTTMEMLPSRTTQASSGVNLWSVDNWRGRLIRMMFIIPILVIDGLTMEGFITIATGKAHLLTATSLVLEITYFTFFIVTTYIFAANFITGKSTTTVVPGITSIWYKAYTAVLMILAVVMIVLASVQTRKSACGQYTAISQNMDSSMCPGYTFVQNATMQWNATQTKQPAILKIEEFNGFWSGVGNVTRVDL
jgi:hypothetical protein